MYMAHEFLATPPFMWDDPDYQKNESSSESFKQKYNIRMNPAGPDGERRHSSRSVSGTGSDQNTRLWQV